MKLTTYQQQKLASALYTINRHVKTASDKKPLYGLKKESLDQLIRLGYASKKGLHFSDNPKQSKQHSTTLVEFGEYLFHLPVAPEDKMLPHLGKLDYTYANPQAKMSLQMAKTELENFLQRKKPTERPKQPITRYKPLASTPSPSEYRRSQKNPYK